MLISILNRKYFWSLFITSLTSQPNAQNNAKTNTLTMTNFYSQLLFNSYLSLLSVQKSKYGQQERKTQYELGLLT